MVWRLHSTGGQMRVQVPPPSQSKAKGAQMSPRSAIDVVSVAATTT